MGSISIFLSYPKPFLRDQVNFIDAVKKHLSDRGFEGRTLGVTDYDMKEHLTAIRRLMLESNGLISIAFRRLKIENAIGKPASDIGEPDYRIKDQWLTSPYCHIEPAMAFQVGLPILIFREQGVIAEGILEKGVTGTYLPEFNLSNPINEYFESHHWKQIMGTWEGYVRSVVDYKGKPPKLY